MVWFPHRRRSTNPRSGDAVAPIADAMIEEIDAVLSGAAEAYFGLFSPTIPPWCRINRLAHADLPALRRYQMSLAVIAADGRPGGDGEWATVQAALAKGLLGLVGDDASLLRQIQRSSLIPLELSMIAGRSSADLSPQELLDAGRAAMERAISE